MVQPYNGASQFMTIDPRISELSKIIDLYWDPDRENSFSVLDQKLIACEKKAHQERELSLPLISSALPHPDQISWVLEQRREVLRQIVEEVRTIEKALSDAHRVDAEGYVISLKAENGNFAGNYGSFSKRFDRLLKEINLVYRNALYPFLQILQNGEKGWDPQGLICRGWDFCYWWKLGNPRKEILAAFPFKELL